MSRDERNRLKGHIEEYAAVLPDFKRYAAFLDEVLNRIRKVYSPLGIVQTRAKALDSFAGKIARKKKYTDPCRQLTDLTGARVITMTQEECDRVCEVIRESFDIDEVNSVDKSTELKPNEFGYLSIHLIVLVPENRDDIFGIQVPVSYTHLTLPTN